MGYRNIIIAGCLAAVAAAPVAAAPVSATVDADGKALILIPLTLTKISDLDFGSVIPSGTSGTVIIDPATGDRTVTGGIVGVPSADGNQAYFGGAGSAGQQVVVVIAAPATLSNGTGGTIGVVTLTQDGSPIRTVDPTARTFFVGVGGMINIGANQAEGDYTGTFTVTANYL